MIDEGIYQLARWVESPNFNERPDCEISLLVIHNISLPPGQFGTGCIEQFFCNQLSEKGDPFFREIAGLTVSAHLLIERDGNVIQFVPFHQRAWHAGESCFGDQVNCNDFSIGIELEGTDETPYTKQQYQSLVEVTQELRRQFPAITVDRIVGHQHIAPLRKTDPGPAFDWDYFRKALKEDAPLMEKGE